MSDQPPPITDDQTPLNIPEPPEAQPLPATHPTSKLLPLILILLALSLATTGWFFYQNQQLTQQLSDLQTTQTSSSPSPDILIPKDQSDLPPSPPTTTTLESVAELKDIKYSLPQGWEASLSKDNLHLTATGGGYLTIAMYSYATDVGRREYFCQVTKDLCIKETYFTETKIGNISGYTANALDNSGGGQMYFGAKGSNFYVISSYTPPSPNTFEVTYQQVLDSLVF